MESNISTCAICNGDMRRGVGGSSFTADCSHQFHFRCVLASSTSQACPLCSARCRELPSFRSSKSTPPPPASRVPAQPFFRPKEPRVFDDDDPLVRAPRPLGDRHHSAAGSTSSSGTRLSRGTNIGAALRKAAKVLDDRLHRNAVASVILLSDGQDTYTVPRRGQVADYDALVPPSFAYTGDGYRSAPVHTFGFGTDHDAAAMHTIAEATGGTFSFIENEADIQDAFAQCIGGLLSVAVQELRVHVACANTGVRVRSVDIGGGRGGHGVGIPSSTSCAASTGGVRRRCTDGDGLQQGNGGMARSGGATDSRGGGGSAAGNGAGEGEGGDGGSALHTCAGDGDGATGRARRGSGAWTKAMVTAMDCCGVARITATAWRGSYGDGVARLRASRVCEKQRIWGKFCPRG
nr:E3 ubiquitin-protein ligase WAV3-like [Lolium perenne]